MAIEIKEKFYGETVQIGKDWKKVGITLKSDKKFDNVKDLEKASEDLMRLGRRLIKREIEILKNQNKKEEE